LGNFFNVCSGHSKKPGIDSGLSTKRFITGADQHEKFFPLLKSLKAVSKKEADVTHLHFSNNFQRAAVKNWFSNILFQ
jgi:hypothetical protein